MSDSESTVSDKSVLTPIPEEESVSVPDEDSGSAVDSAIGSAIGSNEQNSSGIQMETNIKTKRSVGNLINEHSLVPSFLVIVVILVWAFIGSQMKDPETYFLYSGIVIGSLIVIGIAVSIGANISWVLTGITAAIFLWFVWDTYQAYKNSGQEGLANTQVMLMVSLLATIVIGKFVLSSKDGTSEGLPELISIFMTVVSFIILYLINSFAHQACDTPNENNFMGILANGILFITNFALIGKHPLIALALSVAIFAYFSFVAQKIQGDGDASGESGGSTETTNLIITTMLMLGAIFKIMFPKFSIMDLIYSKPIMLVVNYCTIMAIVAFIAVNILYTAKASPTVISGVLIALAAIVALKQLMGMFSG